MIRRPLLLLCVLSSLGHWRDVSAGEISNPRKIRAAITSISGSMVPPWAAHEAGIFKKYGLQVEVIATPSGVQGTNALIAGEVSFVQIAGGTTTGAAVGGADLKIVATMVGTLVLNLVVRPEIDKPEQLRGKSIGISRFGTSLHTGARLAAKHFGLEPGKDVHIVEIGAGDWIVGALQGNRVQAGVFGYPATSRAVKLGNRVMLHLPSLNIPYASTGVSTRGDIIRDDPDLVRRYLSARDRSDRFDEERPRIHVKSIVQISAHHRHGSTGGVLRCSDRQVHDENTAHERRCGQIGFRRARRPQSQSKRFRSQ